MQEIVDTLKREKAMLIDYCNNSENEKNTSKRMQDYFSFLEQNISSDISYIFKQYYKNDNSKLITINTAVEMQIIKNIGIDEYNNIYLKNEKNVTNCFSYINEIKKDAFIAVISRIFDNTINFIENKNASREAAINMALRLEYSEAEKLITQQKPYPTKKPRTRIDELNKMLSKKEKNDINYYDLFEAYKFNMSKILNVSYEDSENIKMKYIKKLFESTFIIKKNSQKENQFLLNDDQKQTIRIILNQKGENTVGIYINCIKPFLSTYCDEGEDPIQNLCLAIDEYAEDAMPMEDIEEDNFKRKINNYIKNIDNDDFNMLKAILEIPEVKQALNDKSYGVMFPDKVGDLIIEQINQIDISKSVGF